MSNFQSRHLMEATFSVHVLLLRICSANIQPIRLSCGSIVNHAELICRSDTFCKRLYLFSCRHFDTCHFISEKAQASSPAFSSFSGRHYHKPKKRLVLMLPLNIVTTSQILLYRDFVEKYRMYFKYSFRFQN